MINLDKYISLAGDNIPPVYPRAYLFSNKDVDYSIPYTRRFFAKKINDNDVLGVEGDNFKNLPGNIYQKVSVSWQVSGFERNQVKNGRVVQEGAFEYNQKQIKLAEKDMPGLTQKIGGNYLLGFRQS